MPNNHQEDITLPDTAMIITFVPARVPGTRTEWPDHIKLAQRSHWQSCLTVADKQGDYNYTVDAVKWFEDNQSLFPTSWQVDQATTRMNEAKTALSEAEANATRCSARVKLLQQAWLAQNTSACSQHTSVG